MEHWIIGVIVYNFNVLIWLAVGLILFKRLDWPLRLLVGILLIYVVGVLRFWLQYLNIENTPLLDLICLSLAFFLRSLIFKQFLTTRYQWPNHFHLSVTIFLAVTLVVALVVSHQANFWFTTIQPILSIFLLFMMVMSFTIQLQQVDPRPVAKQEWFWIGTGSFLFSINRFVGILMFHIGPKLYSLGIGKFLADLLILLSFMEFMAYGLALLMNARKNRLAVMKA